MSVFVILYLHLHYFSVGVATGGTRTFCLMLVLANLKAELIIKHWLYTLTLSSWKHFWSL